MHFKSSHFTKPSQTPCHWCLLLHLLWQMANTCCVSIIINLIITVPVMIIITLVTMQHQHHRRCHLLPWIMYPGWDPKLIYHLSHHWFFTLVHTCENFSSTKTNYPGPKSFVGKEKVMFGTKTRENRVDMCQIFFILSSLSLSLSLCVCLSASIDGETLSEVCVVSNALHWPGPKWVKFRCSNSLMQSH